MKRTDLPYIGPGGRSTVAVIEETPEEKAENVA